MAGTQDAEALFARGAAALDAGDLAGAQKIFRALVTAHPRLHAGWNALSVVAIRAGDPAQAESHARRALELDRRNALYLNNLGVALGELGRFEDAEAEFRRALKLRPIYPEGLFNLGKVLHKQSRLGDALRAYERAYAMDREFPGLRLALAAMHQLQTRPNKALGVMRDFPALDDRTAAYYADMLGEAEGSDAAIVWTRSVMASNPGWARVRYSLALALLSCGRWREGWAEYRSRPSAPSDREVALAAKLEGKRVLLRAEQGLGDILFFLRFAPALHARGARITLQCPAKLAGVLGAASMLEGITDDADARAFEHAVWIGDLPFLLDAEETPPAFALQGAKPSLESFGPAPYLALTWRAGTDTLRQREHGNFREALSKEIDLASVGNALSGWKGTVLSLQRNPAAGEIDALSRAIGSAVHDLAALNEDLPAILGLLNALDEYVTVSNTNVHLIAGLGRRARVLMPYPPEWRWMREGAESPWFPGFSLYRQPASRNWRDPLARLRRDLGLD